MEIINDRLDSPTHGDVQGTRRMEKIGKAVAMGEGVTEGLTGKCIEALGKTGRTNQV